MRQSYRQISQSPHVFLLAAVAVLSARYLASDPFFIRGESWLEAAPQWAIAEKLMTALFLPLGLMAMMAQLPRLAKVLVAEPRPIAAEGQTGAPVAKASAPLEVKVTQPNTTLALPNRSRLNPQKLAGYQAATCLILNNAFAFTPLVARAFGASPGTQRGLERWLALLPPVAFPMVMMSRGLGALMYKGVNRIPMGIGLHHLLLAAALAVKVMRLGTVKSIALLMPDLPTDMAEAIGEAGLVMSFFIPLLLAVPKLLKVERSTRDLPWVSKHKNLISVIAAFNFIGSWAVKNGAQLVSSDWGVLVPRLAVAELSTTLVATLTPMILVGLYRRVKAKPVNTATVSPARVSVVVGKASGVPDQQKADQASPTLSQPLSPGSPQQVMSPHSP
jgi:hypothetical protein